MSSTPHDPQPNHREDDTDIFDGGIVEVTGGEVDTTIRPTTEQIRKYLESKPWLLKATTFPDDEIMEVTGGEVDTTIRPTTEQIRKYLESKPWLLRKASLPSETPPDNNAMPTDAG